MYACIPSHFSRFAVASLLLVAGGAAGCDDGSPPSVLDLDDLVDGAESPVAVDDSVPPPLGEVKDIVELSPDSVLVLQSNHPFGHLYGERGGFLAALGPRGQGPGELLDPWSAVRLDDGVWIQSRGEYFVWDLLRLDEVQRGRLPPGTLAIFRGCDGQLASLYEGRSAPESDTRRYGVQTLLRPGQTGEEGWADLSGLTRSPTPFVLGTPFSRPLPVDRKILVNNPFERRVDVLSCGGAMVDSLPLPVPEEWDIHPFPRGIAELDQSAVVFFARKPVSDTTHVAVWSPSRKTLEDRQVAGDVRVIDNGGESVWLVVYTPVPRIYRVERSRLREFLGIPAEGDRE